MSPALLPAHRHKRTYTRPISVSPKMKPEPRPKPPSGAAFTGFIVDADSPGIVVGRKEARRRQDRRAAPPVAPRLTP